MSSEKAAELLASYDKDGSGLIELDEFQELCIALNRLNLNLAGTIDEKDMKAAELWSAFNRFDSNHSGKLDARELRKALATVKVEMDSKQAEELIAKYDKDQSGLMEFEEFEKLCTALEAVNVNLAGKELREAESGLQNAMDTGTFFISKNDTVKLESAVEKAKKAGVDAATLAAAEAKLAGTAAGGAVVDAGKKAGSMAADAGSAPAIKEAEKRLKEATPSLF